MPITTTIARHYAARCLMISIGALVFGLWGLYDYAYKIPSRQRQVERGEVCHLVKDALEPGRWSDHAEPAIRAVRSELERIEREHFGDTAQRAAAINPYDEEELAGFAREMEAAIEAIRERDEEQWLVALVLFDRALAVGEPRSHPLTGIQLLAYDVADKGAQQVANVKPPAFYDRPVQWMFIACLPFFPLYLWFFVDAKRRTYRLDEEGTLHFLGPRPESWPAREIADIDMSRWMARSYAHVIHTSGKRVKLDDYKHRDLHLIIGAIAARLHPDRWDAQAKPVATVSGEAAPIS